MDSFRRNTVVVIKDKKILLGVTGAISAYKALELARLLIKKEAAVWPVMTRSAKEFITPLSLSTLAKNPVYSELFELTEGNRISHIELAQTADLIVVAPATADFIGKAASGIADDLLTTIVMAAAAPVLIAPSMNTVMWENPIVVANVGKLKGLGYLFVEPEEGELACGRAGKGRLAAVEDITEAAIEALSAKDLKGEKVLVTAGPTREPIDPVRYVSNASSGRMGYAIARAAKRRGAEVVLVSGPSSMPRPSGITFVPVSTAEEMHEACVSYYPQSTLVIMAAAVADYRPKKSYPTKVKKDAVSLTVDMERTEDVLKYMGKKKKGDQFLVGFALETENLEENARKKLNEKNLDLVVANPPAGLDSETNQVTIINRDNDTEVLPAMSKDEVADRILDNVVRLKRG
ncbi:MAG: bifunctional phosphopantothenoylcysteine decarboxylase/phosphopantothenate--cysteine ligase CoaBC [Deltaproteobacteria bacterium]|nr:bifunctional phosphopantothenoylcysteine decarboxylase/phosphopantothenate--cysteine ligase CoaBC [Deltaproteobacteria bacterium]